MRSCRAVSGLNGLKGNLQVHTSHQRLHCWPARKGKNQKVIVSSGATYLSPVAVSTIMEHTAGEEAPTPAEKLISKSGIAAGWIGSQATCKNKDISEC